jgi:ribosome biogenesis SPOUT family RNA methylase Rps3
VSMAGMKFLDIRTQMRAVAVLATMKPEASQKFVADLSQLTPKEFKECQVALFDLDWALRQILEGVDAKKLFGQLGRHKPKHDTRNIHATVAFWSARAAFGPDSKGSIDKAVKAAQTVLRDLGYHPWKLAKRRMLDIVNNKRQREWTLDDLEQWALPPALDMMVPSPPEFISIRERGAQAGRYLVTKKQVAALRAHLENKTKK